ncbi:hypothetical protein A3A66_01985 [Microgenomates group bacterium RIFCSPLOWO2_01_FULL_46_13]|nr:MAG: hypothetical protein A3A66_01985 [Microgenomates group bacterium RIFCSPLOWO2_01_FULL_46_13]
MSSFSSKRIGTCLPLTALAGEKVAGESDYLTAGISFARWLSQTGQTIWQVLPLHQTHLEAGHTGNYVASPYKGYGIGLDPRFLPSQAAPSQGQVDSYSFEQFVNEHGFWLADYALFCSLRDYFDSDNWTSWPEALRNRKPQALKDWSLRLQVATEQQLKLQWRLHAAYRDFKEKVNDLNIELIGDAAFYLPLNSPLVWVYQDLFVIGKDGSLPRVSGIPAGLHTHYGRQVWGHPLYRWHEPDKHQQILKLWQTRLIYLSFIYDILRLDHAKGFFTYGSIDPFHSKNDKLLSGPGETVLKAVITSARQAGLEVIAEDSGGWARPLRLAISKWHVPGMKILRFALLPRTEGLQVNTDYAQVTKYPVNCVAYTTTHDTEPLVSYLTSLPDSARRILAQKAKITYSEDTSKLAVRLRQALLNSPARIILLPLQDWLLSAERINTPGTEQAVNDPNWRFHLHLPIDQLPVEPIKKEVATATH